MLDRLRLRARRRLPVILQTETAECGLACLAMIAHYHGRAVDPGELRRRFGASQKGTTLPALIAAAERLGLAARAVRLELEDIGALRRPCVLHWSFNHFVVLERAAPARGLVIHDPASGKRRIGRKEASSAFTGVALELWPSAAFVRAADARRVRLRELVGEVRGVYGTLAQVLALAAALEVFALAAPLYLQWVADHVLVSGNRDLLTTLALGFGLLLVLQQTIAALRAWVIMHCGATLNVQWQANAFSHLLRLPLGYFEKRHLGDIVSRFRSVDVIQRTLSTAFIEALVDGAMTLVLVAVLLVYSPLLCAVSLSAILLYAFIRWLWYRPLRSATEEQIVQAARQDSHFLETVRGVRAIKLFQRNEERRAAWLTLLIEQLNAGLRVQRLHVLYRLANGVTFGLENLAVVFVGARAVLDGRFSVGMLLAFLAYKSQLTGRITALIDKLVEVKMLRLHGERLADVVLTEPEAAGDGRLLLAEPKAGAPVIELRGVRYRYAEHESEVLAGIDLAVAAGESVAITGPSGSGKSTLVNLLLGILAPTAGEVLIGGVSVAAAGAAALRGVVGAVTQADTLFAGSIAENISLFDPQPDQARVEECAKLAAIHADIAAMPMGYNTLVGYLGAALSGGQQQRILLARALYKRPSILILDEATSHLDLKRELLVAVAIRTLAITRVIVAHRPQTAATADRILVLEAGKIVRETRNTPNIEALHAAARRAARS